MQRRRDVLWTFIVLCGLTAHAPIVSATMNPRDILARADQARGHAEGVQWQIDIEVVEQGNRQAQTLYIKARDFNFLAETLAPPKAKGRTLLMRDRTMWFVQPGLHKPVPISPRQRLLGGAANGDLAATDYAGSYEVLQMSETLAAGVPCYLFDLKAIDSKATYDRIRYWVATERLVGVRAEFFTAAGKLLKSATFAYDHTVQLPTHVQPFISRMTITDAVLTAQVTTLTYSRTQVERIPEATFDLNLLLR